MPTQKTLREIIEEILKNYHCWHTPIDCSGCDKVEPCNKETSQATDQILQMVEEKEKKLLGLLGNVLESLVDMVNQHCQVKIEEDKFYVDDMALSANEGAFETLENFGLLKYKDGSRRAMLSFDVDACLAQIRERIGE